MNVEFPVPPLRKGHRLDIVDTSVYWFEMEHPYEKVPNFLTIFNNFVVENNWHKFIKPGSTVIDIGGHSGDTAVPMQFLARGTVLCVEPNPVISPYMDLTCMMNSRLG